jgi:Putative transposase
MADSAAHLVDEVIPFVPVRLWVLSFSIPLRILFAAHPELLTPVLRIIHRVIAGFVLKQAGLKRTTADTGAVTLIQRFGSAANLNIHVHGLVLDGVYQNTEGEPVFREACAPTREELQGLLARSITRLMKMLTRRGYLVEEEGMTYIADMDADNPLASLQVTLGHRKYKAQISPVLKNLIQQFVDQLPEQGFADVQAGVVRHAVEYRVKGAENPERYVEEANTRFAEMSAAQIVHPLLTQLEGPFKEAAYSAEDPVYEVESGLTDAMCAPAAEHMAPAINTLLLSGDSEQIEAVIAEFFTLVAVKP